MPTYEYKCEACGNEFEKFQSITAAAIKKCPKCGKNKVKRLIGTGAAMIFKGGGFYITDYRSEAYKDSAKADKPPGAVDAKTGTDKAAAEKSGGEKTASDTTAKSAPDSLAKPASETPKPAAEPKSLRPPGKNGKKRE